MFEYFPIGISATKTQPAETTVKVQLNYYKNLQASSKLHTLFLTKGMDRVYFNPASFTLDHCPLLPDHCFPTSFILPPVMVANHNPQFLYFSLSIPCPLPLIPTPITPVFLSLLPLLEETLWNFHNEKK